MICGTFWIQNALRTNMGHESVSDSAGRLKNKGLLALTKRTVQNNRLPYSTMISNFPKSQT